MRKSTISLIIILVLFSFGGLSSLAEAIDLTPAEVKGVFVNKATGQPAEIMPAELGLFVSCEGMTEAECAALDAKMPKIEVETNSSGAFLIKNVMPGQQNYYIKIRNDILPPGFTVSPGQTVDLGIIEIEQ